MPVTKKASSVERTPASGNATKAPIPGTPAKRSHEVTLREDHAPFRREETVPVEDVAGRQGASDPTPRKSAPSCARSAPTWTSSEATKTKVATTAAMRAPAGLTGNPRRTGRHEV